MGPVEGVPELGTDGPEVVLVGVDGSDTSLRAAAYAAGLARRQRSRLVVVHVRTGTTPLAGLVPGSAAVASGTAREIADEVEALVARGAAQVGIPVEYVPADGDPVVEITRIADALLADAVVVGASQQAGHRWVGSIAVRLVKAGRWPVTVVP
ncbi:universal stress protein [Klenkia taihuensis]|uniref:Nucleotide-binding universal stress protein, UspA family n=1 Tax=Klenkia taihuensis TaxID=1225127 RepID=A0A1I1P427_9ACTN|nr:universal stress protein [Klenkia taihuensis]GHE11481.1 universal stress protein A [Klenkia taihuensis]SFD04322.1 Nucleotide-binding universal stress protein, UspA family [Klenkia taihuensis]